MSGPAQPRARGGDINGPAVADCGVARTSGIELGGWQMKKLETTESGTEGCPRNRLKRVSLRLGFASEGQHNDLAEYYYYKLLRRDVRKSAQSKSSGV